MNSELMVWCFEGQKNQSACWNQPQKKTLLGKVRLISIFMEMLLFHQKATEI
jgi:hypothetical protein